MPEPWFLVSVLVGGFVFGSLARLIVPGSQRLTWSETTIVGIAGAALGAIAGNIAVPDAGTTSFQFGTLIGALGGSVIVLVVVNIVMTRLGIRQEGESPKSSAEMIAEGENHSVEFKQTARWNVHTEERDPKIELVIAKTVAGFLNAEGGSLFIGVDDDGNVLGLDRDLGLMKEPDLDRYELWLTDLIGRCLGKPVVANVTVTFELVDRNQLCRVDVDQSLSPVFLDEPGGNREADMYVRMGNSTRKLLTDEALEYVKNHWD